MQKPRLWVCTLQDPTVQKQAFERSSAVCHRQTDYSISKHVDCLEIAHFCFNPRGLYKILNVKSRDFAQSKQWTIDISLLIKLYLLPSAFIIYLSSKYYDYYFSLKQFRSD